MPKTYILHQDTDNGYINKNLLYILGFDPSLGTLIFDDKKIILIFDARYFKMIMNYKLKIKNKLKEICNNNFEVEYILLNGDIFKKIENYIKGKNIVLEKNIPTAFYKNIKKLNPKNIDFIENRFEKERLIKTAVEIKNIKKAINIIEKVYRKINLEKGSLIGKTEIQVRLLVQKLIIEYGGEGESFPTIVAFGKNSAIPHHQTGKTKIGNGPILIDMGCIYKGYCSDFTRTFWVGERNSIYNEFIKIQNIVKKAHDLLVKYIKEKSIYTQTNHSLTKTKKSKDNFTYSRLCMNKKSLITGKNLDKIVRDYISEKGYGNYFTHSTGHGVGLQIHELPWISSKKGNQSLEKGMSFTIEPGIYLSGKFGVRLENIIIL